MNLKDVTLDQLRGARPDLLESVENIAVEQLGKIVVEMTTAGLNPANPVHFSSTFLKQMLGTKGESQRSALIADRAAAAKSAGDSPTKPGSDPTAPTMKDRAEMRSHESREWTGDKRDGNDDPATRSKRFLTHSNLRNATREELAAEALMGY